MAVEVDDLHYILLVILLNPNVALIFVDLPLLPFRFQVMDPDGNLAKLKPL